MKNSPNGLFWCGVGAVNAAIAVAAGAFAAHGLKERLTPDMLAIFETGARYHMYHALAIIAAGLIATHLPRRRNANAVGAFFHIGIILFSGSLYALAITGIKMLGAITPLGGVAFLIGWGLLACQCFNTSKNGSATGEA